jgi:TonB-dependent receptor
MRLRTIAAAAPLLTALVATASAQTGRGLLTGSVTDAQGRALQGAEIAIDPGNFTARTDQQGQFTLTALATGSYTVTITYAGFETYTQQVTLAAGQPLRVDASLKIASSKQDIQVYAGREGGEVEAINRTFNADNIINVLPADVITSLPNANVADAIGRLPSVTLERDEGEGKYVKIRGTEPRLTHVTLDGVQIASPETVRQIKLDLIPADLVESVQINKTLQASMEGDGIGGSVDLRTKSAQDRPTIYLESTGGYTPILTGRPAYQFDGTLGQRFLEGKKLGALISGSYDWNGRGINDVEPGPALAGTYDLRDYRYFRDRRGFGGTLDYRLSDTSSLYLKGLYSHFNNFGDDYIYSPTINDFANSTTLTEGAATGGSTHFQALSRRPIQDIGGLQLGGHHVLGRSLFDWNLNSSAARTRDAGYTIENFAPAGANDPLTYVQGVQGIQYNIDLTNPLLPHINVLDGKNIFDPTQYFFVDKEVENTYNSETDLGFGASLAIPYTVAGHANTFELGGLFRNEHKFINQGTFWFAPLAAAANPADPSLAMSNFLGTTFRDPNYYGGNYTFGPAVNTDTVEAFAPVGPDPNHSNVVGNSFDQIEKVSAGYLTNTTNLGRFRINLGLRIEATGENNLGYSGSRNSNTPGTVPIRAQYTYINPLPSASVRYAFRPTQAIRLVYGRGLARPNFSDLIPFAGAPSGGTARNTVSIGNPNLKAEYADDIDLLYENNISGTGLLTAGFFYKNLSNPIVATQTIHPADNIVSTPYIANQTINAGSGFVYGFEIAYIDHFNQLPGLLSGLGLSTNYGYTASQAHLPPYVDPATLATAPVGTVSGPNRGPEGANPALIGQAPNSFNFSPTYDRRKLSVRLGMTYNQANIAAYQYTTGNNGPITQGGGGGGPQGPNGDNYFYSHLQVDLQGSYRLPRGLTVVAYGLNLNNEVFGFYNGSPNFPVQREFYRQTFGGGLRWSPTRERK